MSRIRNFCFTWNNYPVDAESKLTWLPRVKYLVAGREVGESGTPHLQGFVYFSEQKTLSAVIKLLPGCHVEVSKTLDEAIAYCKKDGDYFEVGIPPMSQSEKGKKGKEYWEEVKKLACEGKLDEIDAKVYVSHFTNLQSIARAHMTPPPVLDTLENRWIYGPTGTGKSRNARLDYPGAYYKACNKWWDGYQDEEVVIIEDLDKDHACLGHHLKIWADHGPFIAEFKGGARMIRPKKIIVTSNYSLSDIWTSAPSTLDPLLRRFNEEYKGHNVVVLAPRRPVPTEPDIAALCNSEEILIDGEFNIRKRKRE